MTTLKLSPDQIRAKYMKIVETKGVDEAITKVHRDMGFLEPHVFDGGFNGARFEELQTMRALARDLYTHKLTQSSKHYYK